MNEGGAVMAAGFFNTMLRHIDQVKIANMTGSQEFAGVWKRREQVYAVPAYYAFQLYTQVKGDSILPATTDSGTYSVKGGVRPLDTVSEVPYVDVVATRSADGKTVTLLCVNRHLTLDIPTRFDLESMHATAPATMKQIYSVSRYERNSEIEPKHVLPLEGTAKVATDGAISVILPHESVTVIRVPVK
jgi:alpha-N-arabinofuranosidase